jgi:hypothetical protein
VALAGCYGRSHPELAAEVVVVNESVNTIAFQWNSPGLVGPIGASTQSEPADGCARYDRGVQVSDSGLVIRSYAASLSVPLPPPAEMATLYYLVLPDGRIEATTADVANAIPTPDPGAPVPSVCPTP